MTIVTRSIAASAGCVSRSSSASVRSARTSRIGDGSSSRRAVVSRVTRRSRTCSTAAPRSRRSRRVDNGSSSRVRTKDSGSRSAIGHSRSSDASNRSSSSMGTSGRRSSPRAIVCHTRAGRPSRETRSAVGRDARSPSVFTPHRLAVRSTKSEVRAASASPSSFELRTSYLSSVSRIAIGSEARASASSPGAMTVSPGRAWASNTVAMRVPAIATCTRTPRAAASRRISSPIVRAGPSRRVSPLTSTDTRSSRCCS